MQFNRSKKIALALSATLGITFALFQNFTPPADYVYLTSNPITVKLPNGSEVYFTSLDEVAVHIDLIGRGRYVPGAEPLIAFLKSYNGKFQVADVNNDGVINPTDGQIVKDYALGFQRAVDMQLTFRQMDWIENSILKQIAVRTPVLASTADVPQAVLRIAVKNYDQEVDGVQLFLRTQVLSYGKFYLRADINRDGIVSSADAMIFQRIATGAFSSVNAQSLFWYDKYIAPYLEAKTPQFYSMDQVAKALLSISVGLKPEKDLNVFLKGKVYSGTATFLRGDVNFSGSITSADALAIQRFGLKLNEPATEERIAANLALYVKAVHSCKLERYQFADFTGVQGSSSTEKAQTLQDCLLQMKPGQLTYNTHQCKSWRLFFDDRMQFSDLCK